jgi:hypothetical protein
MASPHSLLRNVLRLNGLSCLVFGGLLATLPADVAAFLGQTPELLLRLVGFGLLANGAHLLLVSLRKQPSAAEVMWFSLGDLAWWSASLLLFAAGIWVTSPFGIAALLAVALMVASLGLAQIFLLGMRRKGVSAQEHWRAIGRSWMALPLWVKLWLTVLNVVFLAAFSFMPSDIGRITLAAYFASGPLLFAFAFQQGGLTRHMGAAHLLTFAPLLAWLWTAHGTLTAGELRYAIFLAAALILCLAWDVWDIARWLKGEREVIGGRQPRSSALSGG